MRKFLLMSTAAALLCLAGASHARDPIDDGKLLVKPSGTNQYEVGEYRFGKAEFFGYVGDLKDSKKITGILLKRGDKASAEQKHIIAITAKTQQIDAFIELDGKVVPLVDDAPPAAPAATPETH
ncbi:MAG: hypothetical protein P4L92_15450 [Rudaea sp.]|nr:hypothetical protein [Rudaea sp.]